MNTEQIKKNEKPLLRAMPEVSNCLSLLTRLDRQWTMATMTGKINCSRIAQTLIDFIIKTQDNFSTLKEELIDTLILQNTQKVVLEITALAQVAIDILKRNLFERTADVGFLATDMEIVNFLKDSDQHIEETSVIEERLSEYRNKYTVYNEILILDTEGIVRAHLDHSNHVSCSSDPLISKTLNSADYVETYRSTDLLPGRGDALIYSQAIVCPDSGMNLGVLCLVFDFAGEMKGIFKHLSDGSNNALLMILDSKGKTIASSDEKTVPLRQNIPITSKDGFNLATLKSQTYISKTVDSKGYQGFLGLPWFGQVYMKLDNAFTGGSNDLDADAIRSKAFFSERLTKVETASENVLSDLELVVQNGEIMAAKKCIEPNIIEQMEGRALPHILNEIKKIGDQVQNVFQFSTDELLKTVSASRLSEVKFLACLAIDIMDRNLYERANDCRWWALTPDFRKILDQPEISETNRATMRNTLAYINNLYTVYTNLFIYDCSGTILACSNSLEYHQEGSIINSKYVGNTLKLTDTQRYCVSDFNSTPLYSSDDSARNTYIYSASITSINDPEKVLGGIGIVFDSEPEFLGMLQDTLPKDEQGNYLDGAEAIFIEPGGKIISSTNPEHKVGQTIKIQNNYGSINCEHPNSELIEQDGQLFAVGCAKSEGYREYKCGDGYTNEVISVFKIKI